MKLSDLRKLDRDELLSLVGLERKSSTDWIVPTLGALSVGILVGAGLGLLFAPKSGREIREDLGRRIQDNVDSLSSGQGFSGVTNLDKTGTRSSI